MLALIVRRVVVLDESVPMNVISQRMFARIKIFEDNQVVL